MKILWVEDKYDQIRALADILYHCGHEIVVLDSVAKAVKEFKKGFKRDLVILDSVMPGEDKPSHSGCKIFRDLRDGQFGEWGNTVPVYFVTGYGADVARLVSDVSPPPRAILIKPLMPREIVEELLESFDEFKEEMRRLVQKPSGVTINFQDVLNNIGNPNISVDQNVDIDIDLKISLPELQQNFRKFTKEISEFAEEELKEELEHIEKDLFSITPNSDQNNINVAVNKLYGFLQDFSSKGSTFQKVASKTKKGIEFAQETARCYNKFAQWLALPQVPDIFL